MTSSASSPRLWALRHSEYLRRNAAGVIFVLLLHLALGLLLLSLAPPVFQKKVAAVIEFSFIEDPAEERAAEAEQVSEAAAEPETTAEPEPEQPPAPPAAPNPVELPPLPPEESSALAPPPAPANAPAAPPSPPAPPAPPAKPKRVYGPPDVSQKPAPDSVRVDGTGPNGEPLYAAEWYREPYDSELSGYLSTARGPGWGLIACRTAPDYRVQDCVFIEEYPGGSGIGRSTLAAAWQFRVRPPRVGGRDQVGEWVRIRIDYQYRGAYAQ